MHAGLLPALASGFQPIIGQAISIRPLRADDFEIEAEFLRGLSVQTRNRRLLGGARPVTDEYVARLTHVDYPRELALAATVMLEARESLIGVARYALDPAAGGCEFAIVIADPWQGRGIGAQLLERLIDAARAHSITRIFGYSFADNRNMLKLARRLGFRIERMPGDATLLRVTRELSAVH